MPEEMTLGEFVKQLTVSMEAERLVMLFKEEAPWHLLFYSLKKSDAAPKPSFLASLRFDWDGPYPRCQELSEFIQALHWTGSVVAANPSYDRISLQKDVSDIWAKEGEKLSPELAAFLAQGIEIAKGYFPTQVK